MDPCCEKCDDGIMKYDEKSGDWICNKCGYRFPDFHDGDPGQ